MKALVRALRRATFLGQLASAQDWQTALCWRRAQERLADPRQCTI